MAESIPSDVSNTNQSTPQFQNSNSASVSIPMLVPVSVPASAPVSTAAASSSASILKQLMHKNKLQEHTQKLSLQLPTYQTVNEGKQHLPKFRSTVIVDGTHYSSPNTFLHRKEAEQDAARVAMECLSKKMKDEGFPLIHKDTMFCKSILYEYAVKMQLKQPTYNTVQSQEVLPVFVSSLVFNGITYTGDAGRTKKEAEQLAARSAILSLMGNPLSGTIISEIIMSKSKLYAALDTCKDSESNIHSSDVPASHKSKDVNKGKEAEVALVASNVPVTTCAEDIPGIQPHHEFNVAKPESKLERVELPITFVHAGQSLDASTSSGKKRKKNKKKPRKKMRKDSQLLVNAIPLSQVSVSPPVA